ncbi:terminase large subunit domain-containing protein [Paracoccus marcusii]|uniref:Terminase large subunit n=1 Tax=Paracoccus marcusii TaxID=59779 RepID=A0ABY7UNA2_9RHOB|nr:terminase large subunit [Paracoccus marcusii]WDA11416.1 terminase large subunit [Paracoccus marcusii]
MSATEALPRFACPDWWEKLQAGDVPMADVPINEAKAARVLAFFNRLRLPDVPGNPTMAEACGDWFKTLLVAFFASEDPDTHRELVWELLCMVPKKNSKSTYVAALALTALYMEEAPNRQMLLVGPSQNISERCFEQAQGMVALDEKLQLIFKVQDHLKTITRRKTGTSLDVKTFDTTIVTGEIPVLTIIDELHELGKKAKALKVMQQIRGGGITMQRGKLLMITTQSDEMPTGIWKAELKKARAIRDGKGGPKPIMLPILYEYPEAQQKDETFWRDRSNWGMLLPNLGLSISEQALEEDYENNGKVSKEAEQIWASQHLNIEIGVGLGGDAWRGADYWETCGDEKLNLDEVMRRSEVCVVGIDGGGLDDLFALTVLGREKGSRRWLHWAHAWAFPEVFERRKDIDARLRDFEADGDLTICQEVGDDVTGAIAYIQRLEAAALLPIQTPAIGLDAAGINELLDGLEMAGFDDKRWIGVGQGWKLNPAVLTLPRRLKDRKLVHCASDYMAWTVGNAKTELKGSNYIVTKQAAGSAKIDALMATFNAAMLMFGNPEAPASLNDFLSDPVMVI